MLGDAGTLGGFVNGLPDNLLCNRHICPSALHRAWEKVGFGLHPSPVLAQGIQQLRGQQNIAVAPTLAFAHTDARVLCKRWTTTFIPGMPAASAWSLRSSASPTLCFPTRPIACLNLSDANLLVRSIWQSRLARHDLRVASGSK